MMGWIRLIGRRFFPSCLACSFAAVSAYAEPDITITAEASREQIANTLSGQQLIIVADDKTRSDATSYVNAFQASLEEQGIGLELSVFLSTAGAFSISLGSLEAERCDGVVAELVAEGVVPQDTSCSYPERFVALFRVEGDALIPVLGRDFTATEAEQAPDSGDELKDLPDEDVTGTADRPGDHAESAASVEPRPEEGHPVIEGKRKLGKTLVELGPVSEIGFWLYTDLAESEQQGWVKDGTGATVAVELRPLEQQRDGSPGLLSLEAMLALKLPFGQVSDLQVLVPMSEEPASDSPAEEAPIASPSQTSELSRPFVQVGTFRVEANALATRDQMKQAGLDVAVKPVRIDDNDFWRVIVGPAENEDARRELLEQVRGQGFSDAFAVAR